ncbi:MAG: hypothetical protein ACR2HY_06190 [Acidimicrobiales bacterium]
MSTARVAGHDFDLEHAQIELALSGVDPEPINQHYAVINGRRFPPKQALAVVTGLDRADFTTHQARAILQRLGFGVYRRSSQTAAPGAPERGPHGGAEAAVLEPFTGRWIAQEGLEVVFDADTPEAVVRWLHRNHRRARVWRVPSTPAETGSALSGR